jgi:hypothetical protein
MNEATCKEKIEAFRKLRESARLPIESGWLWAHKQNEDGSRMSSTVHAPTAEYLAYAANHAIEIIDALAAEVERLKGCDEALTNSGAYNLELQFQLATLTRERDEARKLLTIAQRKECLTHCKVFTRDGHIIPTVQHTKFCEDLTAAVERGKV